MQDALLIAAGALALLAAGVHGIAGEILVIRRLSPATLPASPFGGARTTQAMIHATWHMTTAAFLSAGVALVLSGAVLEDGAARALGILGAAAFSAYALVAVALGAAHTRDPRGLLRHPGPAMLTATAAIAWWGALG